MSLSARLLHVQLKCDFLRAELCYVLDSSVSPGLCGLVSLATLSHETRVSVRRKQRKRGRELGREWRKERKQEKDTICGTHWISFVMFVKPAGNAYPVRGGWGGEAWGFVKGKCSSDCRESWTSESQTHITHTHTNTNIVPMRTVCVCLQEEVIKEEVRLGTAMFTLGFCFPYKSQSHNISFSSDSCAVQRPRLEDSVVIWHHKTCLQRVVPHSDIYWPIKHRVISQWKGSLFSDVHP